LKSFSKPLSEPVFVSDFIAGNPNSIPKLEKVLKSFSKPFSEDEPVFVSNFIAGKTSHPGSTRTHCIATSVSPFLPLLYSILFSFSSLCFPS
jgi:hypothetical protein